MGRQARRKREWRESGHGERLRDAAFGPMVYPSTRVVQGRKVVYVTPLLTEYRSPSGELLAEVREVKPRGYLTDWVFVVRWANVWGEQVEKTYKTERGARQFARSLAGITR